MAKTAPLTRRLVAEALGTGFLVIAVVGSGAMAQLLTRDVAVQLLANAGATVGALYALITMFGPISGAHFNPLVTAASCLLDGRSWRDLPAYAAAQLVGGAAGAVAANLMFDLPAFGPSEYARDGAHVWFAEAVATAGLLAVIVLVSAHKPKSVAAAVAAWIGGAYWFTSSTSIANPAVTVARSLTTSFAGIDPSSVPMFVAVQVAGAAIALPVLRWLRG
ncbi:MAG: aquaporin family protein [Actinobacteria bacterium]|nr:aquaporin family protein [Actinomycetota bacterium]